MAPTDRSANLTVASGSTLACIPVLLVVYWFLLYVCGRSQGKLHWDSIRGGHVRSPAVGCGLEPWNDCWILDSAICNQEHSLDTEQGFGHGSAHFNKPGIPRIASPRLPPTTTAQISSDRCLDHASIYESEAFGHPWRATLDLLSWPIPWLRYLESSRAGARLVFWDSPAILVVFPGDPEPSSNEETEDVDYMSDNDYYPLSPGLQQVFLTLEPTQHPLDSMDMDKDLTDLPENAKDYSPSDWLQNQRDGKEDRVAQLATAAAEFRREKFHGLPLLPSGSRPVRPRKRTRPSQGDWVLIREMAPNQPEVAHQVPEQDLESDSSETTQSTVVGMHDHFEAELDLMWYNSLTTHSPTLPSISSLPALSSVGRSSDLPPPSLSRRSICSLERLLQPSGNHHQDLGSDASLVVEWGIFNATGANRHAHPDPSLFALGDWTTEDHILTSFESMGDLLNDSVDDEIARCIDAEGEYVNHFLFSTNGHMLQNSDRRNATIVQAMSENNSAGHAVTLSSYVENTAVDVWRRCDDTVDDWVQPAAPNGLIQRHLSIQSLLDEGFAIAQPTVGADIDDSTTTPETLDLDQRVQSGDPTLLPHSVQGSRARRSEETPFSTPIDALAKKRRADELEESLEASVHAKRMRSSAINTQAIEREVISIHAGLRAVELDASLNTVAWIEQPALPLATAMNMPLSPTATSHGLRTDSAHMHTCSDCLISFATAGLLNDHIRRQHARRFGCLLCSRRFNLKTDLERHQRCIHHTYKEGTRNQSWTCSHDPCIAPGKVFTRKDNFERHVKRCTKKINDRHCTDHLSQR